MVRRARKKNSAWVIVGGAGACISYQRVRAVISDVLLLRKRQALWMDDEGEEPFGQRVQRPWERTAGEERRSGRDGKRGECGRIT